MIDFQQQLAPLQQWLEKLEKRERQLVIGGGISLVLLLFYGLLWDPIINDLEMQKSRYQSQQQSLSWMQDSATKVSFLQAGSGNNNNRFKKQSISSLAERSAQSMGIKDQISKLESTKKGVKVSLKKANFDRIIFWLNDLQQKYNIQASNIKLDPQTTSGAVDARITLHRTE